MKFRDGNSKCEKVQKCRLIWFNGRFMFPLKLRDDNKPGSEMQTNSCICLKSEGQVINFLIKKIFCLFSAFFLPLKIKEVSIF